MRRRRSKRPNLQVELLESRVLLSGVDAPSAQAQAAVNSAVEGSGDLRVDLLPYEEWLGVYGNGEGHVTIDLSLLPSSVRTLSVSSFESVTLTGAASLEDLVFHDISFADAGAADLDRLFTFGVDHVRIDTAPEVVMIQGEGGLGSVASRTLLEVDRFAASSSGFIFALADELGLASQLPVEQVPDIVGHPGQTVLMNFRPNAPVKVLDGVSVSVVEGSRNFAQYFLASAEQRALFESSPAFSRSLAEVEHVSLATLLGNFKLQQAITEAAGLGQTQAIVRPLDGGVLGEGLLETRPRSDSPDRPEAVSGSTPLNGTYSLPELGFSEATSQAETTELRPVGGDSPTDSAAVSAAFLAYSPSTREDGGEAGMSALSKALARLTIPLVETVLGLQGQLASFGAMASAELTEQLHAESRPALLVDARSGRQQEGDELVVVNV